MSNPRKATQAKEPSLKEKLSASFLAAFEADFKTHGIAVIERLRAEEPAKYIEVGAKLIASIEQPPPVPGSFSKSDSQSDIALRLLVQAGLADESAATPAMIEQAVAAQLRFVAELEQLVKGN
jgi:hypothetical protein